MTGYFAAYGLNLILMLCGMSPRVRLLRAAKAGLRHGEFHIVYQPLVETGTLRCVGVEALVRWRHPLYGAKGPAEFIHELENSRLIGELTRFVLSEASSGLSSVPFAERWHLSVNVCARHVKDPNFADDICKAAGAMRDRIILELTERSVMAPTRQVIDALAYLRSLGVRLSLDDFGTGFSNLDLLCDYRFDLIKVDQRFIKSDEVVRNSILKAIADFVHAYGAKVVVEGVESAEQHQVVQRSGIDIAQGYWYARPMTIEDLRNFAAAEANREERYIDCTAKVLRED